MVAVYSSYAVRAVQVTQYIHKKFPGMKVIWEGPHCISVPELGLRYADGICFSEGDQAVVDFAGRLEAGSDYLHTPNMAFNVNRSHLVNEVLPPFADLDSLPTMIRFTRSIGAVRKMRIPGIAAKQFDVAGVVAVGTAMRAAP